MNFCYEHNSPIMTCDEHSVCMLKWLQNRLMGVQLYDAITIPQASNPSIPNAVELIFKDLPRTMMTASTINAILRQGKEIHYAPVQLSRLVDAMGLATVTRITYLPEVDNEIGENDFFLINLRRASPKREFIVQVSIQDAMDNIWNAFLDQVAPD